MCIKLVQHQGHNTTSARALTGQLQLLSYMLLVYFNLSVNSLLQFNCFLTSGESLARIYDLVGQMTYHTLFADHTHFSVVLNSIVSMKFYWGRCPSCPNGSYSSVHASLGHFFILLFTLHACIPLHQSINNHAS